MVFSYPNRVYWCDNCNVPLLSNSECPLCGHRTKDARLGKGEVKPIFDLEKKWYHEILVDQGYDPEKYLPGGMCFYYRASVVVDGEKIFRLTYDEASDKWGIQPYKKYIEIKDELNGSEEKLILEANAGFLEEIEQDSQLLCQSAFEKYPDLPCAVSFSGGKDSIVTLDIIRKFQPNIPVIYMNTTIDFPETVDFVRELSKQWNLNLLEIAPNRDFFSMCEDLGPPSKYMKWCCTTSKFAPMSRFIDEQYNDKVLVASGIRRNESNSRAEFDFIQVNEVIPKQILFFPILKWNSLIVWLFHFWKKLPINPVYKLGYSRIGCIICPEKTPRDLSRVKRTHLDIYNRFYQVLLTYAQNNNYLEIENWIQNNKWRFRASKYEKIPIKIQTICSTSNDVLYKIKDITNNNINEFMKIFGEIKSKKNKFYIKNDKIDIFIINEHIRANFKNNDIKHKFEQQLNKAMNCIGCGACISACPYGAISINKGVFTISDKCKKCKKCLNTNGLRRGCVSLNYNQHQKIVKNSPNPF